MNIYIRPDLEEHLRKEESMSGLINQLLHEHYDKQGANIQRPVSLTPQDALKKGGHPVPNGGTENGFAFENDPVVTVPEDIA